MIFKRVVVFGANGQVGRQLVRFFTPLCEVLAVQRSAALFDYNAVKIVDFSNFSEISKILDNFKPDLILNACAHTAVDLAEKEIDESKYINAIFPELLARWCAINNAWLLHYSTDYVFDGCNEDAYVETDFKNPQNVYGVTKSNGESAIQATIPSQHWIFRTSWVFGHGSKNFPKTISNAILNKDTIKVVNDQYGRPTSSNWIAYASMLATSNSIPAGIYNLTSGGPRTSWYGIADEIKKIAEKLLKNNINCDVLPCGTHEYKTAAKRPLNSMLKLNKIEEALQLKSPDWRIELANYLYEVLI